MRYLILLIIVGLVALFILSFGGGLGYAQGGGEVRILTDEVTAHSETGQAVAVGWSDIENFNASNTPMPSKTAAPRTFWAPMLALLAAIAAFIGVFINHLKPDCDEEWQADPDVQAHHSAADAAENARRYSPPEGAT